MRSVVVPVFNEVDSLPDLQRRLGGDRAAGRAGRRGGSVQLSRNSGMEVAMSAGIDQARGDYVVLIQADLQDPQS